MKVSTVAQMRELDRRATAEFGIPSAILMENAGEAAYAIIKKESGVQNKKFAVICGGGNNGGDGFVVARKLHSNGAAVTVYRLSRRDKYREAARQNLECSCDSLLPLLRGHRRLSVLGSSVRTVTRISRLHPVAWLRDIS